MPQPLASKPAKIAAGTAAALLGTAVLDKTYGLSLDVKRILQDKNFRDRYLARAKELGDDTTIYHMLELAKQDAPALWFEGRTWTYTEIKIEADSLAAIFHQRGITSGDVVAVFMTNSPEMVFTTYALGKLGAIPAYINTALRSKTLAHCMHVASPKLIICTPDLASAVLELFSTTDVAIPTFLINLLSFKPLSLPDDNPHSKELVQIRYEDLAAVNVEPIARPKRLLSDTGCLVYTSGTSGKPKAVAIKNILPLLVSNAETIDVKNPKKYFPLRTYSCLPLFHGTALFTGVYYSVGSSSTLCLSRRFSASRFMKELTESGATRMLYVGELCRYLLTAPPTPYDRAHKCITAKGNGLAWEVWTKFQDRYNIPEIREMYRSTEGLARFDNQTHLRSGAGAVQYSGPIRRWWESDTYIVKVDPSTESLYRDPNTGFCVKAPLGEAGEAIGRIRDMAFYHEYLNNPEANEKKIIKDVFEKGDMFQRSGDLLVHEKGGWIRFHERSGDTYRWRGENVSAGEVKEHIARLPHVADVEVYGIKLDKYDGSAGAAVITLTPRTPETERNFIQSFYQTLRAGGLTVWQLPRFVRITAQIKMNATFKHAREVLKALSWDPASLETQARQGNPVSDSLYWLNGDKYEKLDAGSWAEIREGKARL